MVGKLKPCPCCGAPLPGMVRDSPSAYVAYSTFGCWLGGPVAETEEGAARKWNALAGAAEEVERLGKEVERLANAGWWGGGSLSGSQVKRVLSVKHPVTAPNLAFIEYANPERILRLLSTRCRGEDKPLKAACYLLALACQRMHCAGCFLTHHKEWCPKSCNEGRAVMECVAQEEWYSFLREKEGEKEGEYDSQSRTRKLD